MQQEGMLKPALIGGVLLGVLSALPIISAVNCLCCAWVIGGGLLAAHLYVKGSPVTVSLGQGVALGLLTGAIGAIADSIFSIPLHIALSGMGMGFPEQMRRAVEQIPNLPEESRDALRSILTAGGGGIGAVFIVMSTIVKLILYGLMAMIGGAIGVAVFEKRPPGSAPVVPPPPYVPPPDFNPPQPPELPR